MAWSTEKCGGFTVVEALLSVSLLMLFSLGGIAANRIATTSVKINQQRSKANILAVEGMEALYSARAGDFSILTIGDFHPYFDGSKWTLLSGSETANGFTRTITLSPVLRDMVCPYPVCDIVSQGGITNKDSLMARVKVSWLQSGEQKEASLSSLITYWR